jgi:hypothetical protein
MHTDTIRLEQLTIALNRATVELGRMVADTGGCAHDIGFCICDLTALVERFHLVIAEYGVWPSQCVPGPSERDDERGHRS